MELYQIVLESGQMLVRKDQATSVEAAAVVYKGVIGCAEHIYVDAA